MHTIDEWNGCYPSNWKGVIVPESMSHPAKYSSKLIRRIYEHMFQEGWVHEGDRVLDPFGGVALGALDAMRLGLHWTGVELELKFAGLGIVNILSWNNQFGSMPHWGSARLLNGDSRKLIEIVVSSYAASLSSPPYSEARIGQESGQEHCGHGDQYGGTDGQLGSMKAEGFEASLSSPPYAETDLNYKRNGLGYERPYMEGQDGVHNYGAESGQLGAMKPGGVIDHALYARHAAGNKSADGYGTTDGQLSSMKDGSFDAAVSSPPFTSSLSQDRLTPEDRVRIARENGISNAEHISPIDMEKLGLRSQTDYGNTPGQLGDMPSADFEAAVSSPPYEGDVVKPRSSHLEEERAKAKGLSRAPGMTAGVLAQEKYGDSEGQLGNDSGDDFWLAARTIVEQVYLSLAPGGHACWVVKDYVKNKSVVPFCDQWRQLCEAVGFTTLHEHHAMLVHHKGKQHTLDGGMVEKKTESKSFFRRLAEKNGSPRIDYEVVLCMVKHA